jgi:hypothetical protein
VPAMSRIMPDANRKASDSVKMRTNSVKMRESFRPGCKIKLCESFELTAEVGTGQASQRNCRGDTFLCDFAPEGSQGNATERKTAESSGDEFRRFMPRIGAHRLGGSVIHRNGLPSAGRASASTAFHFGFALDELFKLPLQVFAVAANR